MLSTRRFTAKMNPLRRQGLLWACWLGRWSRGHHTLIKLIAGASLFLLVLAFTPQPDPSFTRSPLYGVRRIQQEIDDYTAPKLRGNVLGKDIHQHNLILAEQDGVESLHPAPTVAFSGMREDRAVYNLPLLPEPQSPTNNSQLTMDVPRNKKEGDHVIKAQETALVALQHGYKLTTGQKNLLNHMDPKDKKAMEERISKLRGRQEKTYMEHLRRKRQIIPRKGGGEEIISTPRLPVRFPTSLKKIKPQEWPPQHRIFINLTHYPWSKDDDCVNYSITFQPPGSLPTRALASFPSSGNTWIRYLIEAATGIFTGSLYDDTSLTRKGMYGEGITYDSGMTILQKSHGYTTGNAMKLSHQERLTKNHMDELSHQGVLVIRNPFKALISHRHLDVGGHTGYAPKAHFLGEGWAEFVTLKTRLWRDFYIDWLMLSEPRNIHITYYEDMKTDPVDEMKKILHYLHLPVDDNRLHCVGLNTDGLFKRKPSKNVPLDFNPFTRELKDIVYKAIDEVNLVLKQTGKEGLPLDQYELYDPHEADVAKYIREHIQTKENQDLSKVDISQNP
ncbi:uncharacterized protein [Panulirus ornatus]|uniref:uncharacterized protein isoform X2 n=1 Tax=Panulirus ornatus TaxID=150431 RepID=UPI003A8757A4